MTDEFVKSELYYLKKRIEKLEALFVDIVGALSADAFDEGQLDNVINKFGEIKDEVDRRNEIKTNELS